jgi:methylglutaconyl-CoA hydratase
MEKAYVKLTTINGIGSIEFFHPMKNSMPSELLKKLRKSIDKASEDDQIKVIILKSGGNRVFCAGASFQELVAIKNKDEGFSFFAGFADVINAMRKCPKLIIVRVQGKVVGGGVGIAAAADYCIASKYADIKLSELNLGMGPFVIAPAIERKIGLSSFSQLTLDAHKFYPSSWANEKGLFQNVCDTVEELDASVLDLARRLSSYNTEALRNLKNIFWQNTDHWDDLLKERARTSGFMVLSSHSKKALKGFTES